MLVGIRQRGASSRRDMAGSAEGGSEQALPKVTRSLRGKKAWSCCAHFGTRRWPSTKRQESNHRFPSAVSLRSAATKGEEESPGRGMAQDKGKPGREPRKPRKDTKKTAARWSATHWVSVAHFILVLSATFFRDFPCLLERGQILFPHPAILRVPRKFKT